MFKHIEINFYKAFGFILFHVDVSWVTMRMRPRINNARFYNIICICECKAVVPYFELKVKKKQISLYNYVLFYSNCHAN